MGSTDAMVTDMRFDRSVTDALMSALQDGPARSLVERSRGQHEKPLYDLQLRNTPRDTATRATLYYGMTALINLHERNGRFSLTAGKRYMALESFDPDWTNWQERSRIERAWPRVETYLDSIAEHVQGSPALAKALANEGPVHASLASGNSDAYRVIQREALPSFRDAPIRSKRLAAWIRPFNEALDRHSNGSQWWPKGVKVGARLDFLAVDIGGRLALIEAKADSASARELARVSVQVGVYAAMFADLLREVRPDALDAVASMLDQRTRLGLTRKGVLHLRDKGQVVPVVAIGPGRPSEEAHRRMWDVARAVDDVRGERVDPVEVWYLDAEGRITEVERAEDLDRVGRRR